MIGALFSCKRIRVFSELNSVQSTEFIENYFLILKMKIIKNNILQIV